MKYWTTERGEKLLIKDMSIIHISNTIKFIERKINFPKPGKIYDVKLVNQYIKVFKEELRDKRLEQLL
jgi:dimeric dUTPase (all-alpha-NTP-PPase superfamily)